MLGGRSWDDWIAQYASSHRHPINRICHTLGIPLIVLSIVLFAVALFVPRFWPIPLGLFLLGWIFQFVGHSVYEHKSPAFLTNFLHLLVGPLWILNDVVPVVRAARPS